MLTKSSMVLHYRWFSKDEQDQRHHDGKPTRWEFVTNVRWYRRDILKKLSLKRVICATILFGVIELVLACPKARKRKN
jgi:hypothetical protein